MPPVHASSVHGLASSHDIGAPAQPPPEHASFTVQALLSSHEMARPTQAPLPHTSPVVQTLPSSQLETVFVKVQPFGPHASSVHGLLSVSYTHLTLPTNREV